MLTKDNIKHMHKRIATVLIAIIGFFTFSNAQQTNFRSHQDLDDGWRFHFGHASDRTKDFNFGIANIFAKSGAARGTAIDPRFNDSGWRQLNLPHDWAVELPFTNSGSF